MTWLCDDMADGSLHPCFFFNSSRLMTYNLGWRKYFSSMSSTFSPEYILSFLGGQIGILMRGILSVFFSTCRDPKLLFALHFFF